MENNNSPQDLHNASTEVNFDALSAPEGQYDPFVHGDGSSGAGAEGEEPIPGSTDDLINGLPNLDKDLSQQSQNNQDPNQNQSQQNENQQNQNAQPSGEYWMKPFEQLKAANPEWEIPQGINEENYLSYLQEILQPEIHPELVRMQQAIDAGLEFDKVIETYNSSKAVNQLTDRELMAQKFKNSYKDWTDDKVNEVLNKLEQSGLLEIEAGRHRQEINEQQSHALDNMRKNFEQERTQREAAIAQERSRQIDESLKYINNANEIYGLPISQAEKAEFGEYFAKLVTPDHTGMAPMFQALQSNETLVKVAAMLWKGDAKIKSALTSAKEAGKNSVLSKLDKTPDTVQRGGGPQDPTQIDFDALSAPERLI